MSALLDSLRQAKQTSDTALQPGGGGRQVDAILSTLGYMRRQRRARRLRLVIGGVVVVALAVTLVLTGWVTWPGSISESRENRVAADRPAAVPPATRLDRSSEPTPLPGRRAEREQPLTPAPGGEPGPDPGPSAKPFPRPVEEIPVGLSPSVNGAAGGQADSASPEVSPTAPATPGASDPLRDPSSAPSPDTAPTLDASVDTGPGRARKAETGRNGGLCQGLVAPAGGRHPWGHQRVSGAAVGRHRRRTGAQQPGVAVSRREPAGRRGA